MNPLLSVIIPTMDRQHILAKTLDSIVSATEALSAEIIVVNDSKTENVTVAYPQITVLNNPKQGAASARNLGFSRAQGELVLFLDDDMLVSETVLNDLIRWTLEREKAIFLPNWRYPEAISKSLSNEPFGRFLLHIRYDSLKGWISHERAWEEEVMPHDGIASYCLLLKREDFLELGGYNEAFPFAGFEDYDLTKRLSRSGFQFFILTRLTIFHNEIDRIAVSDFLERRRRNGATQRKAVELGYSESALHYGAIKSAIFRSVYQMRKPLIYICRNFPNSCALDSFHRAIARLLIGAYIYAGYRQAEYRNT